MPTRPKIERWLDLIAFLLCHRAPVARSVIFEQVKGYEGEPESARRTFERDKADLKELGIGIETVQVRGAEGDEDAHGYRLRPADFYLPYFQLGQVRQASRPYVGLPTLVLDEGELGVLDRAVGRMTGLTGHPLAEPAARVRRKLGFDLPLERERLAEVVEAEPGRWREFLPILHDAVLHRHPVRCVYYAIGADATSERVVEPYGLMFNFGHWYCVGRAPERDAVRHFRVDRMLEVTPVAGGTGFERPPGFSVRRLLERAPWELGEAPSTTVRVRFAFPSSRFVIAKELGRVVEHTGVDGSALVEFEVRAADSLLRWLLTFREQAVVESPAGVRDDLAALRERVRARYAS